MIRGIVDDIGVFGAYEVFELEMPVHMSWSCRSWGIALTENPYC